MYNNTPCYVIILAAGSGTRFGGDTPKQFVHLDGVPIVAHGLSRFAANTHIDGIILVVSEYCDAYFDSPKLLTTIRGGQTRQESTYNGLLAVPPGDVIVVIHDGARPFVTDQDINAVISAAYHHNAATLAAPITDTVKLSDSNMSVIQTIDRQTLWLAQTPQAFRRQALMAAHETARLQNFVASDDCQLMENIGVSPKIIQGSTNNIKITHPTDLAFAEFLLKRGAT
ncbi:MAG: 2-C-methyl-D-erythritol 4-phosphate cytidylyltransferase [Defluviitaleaceae bacterium]|nr:2-C-methyl-D-erythritol 4-phosphate cytidylyltransferase [Defluviitaleaceae bacterium]